MSNPARPEPRARWIRTALGVALSFAWILPVEAYARWYCREHGDALERTSLLLQADARLGWRQRGGLSATFLGEPVHTNALGFRAPEASGWGDDVVLVLGPSSTFGWGVRDDETYSAVLQRRLGEGPRAPIVVNAGEIGFSSFQGVRLAAWEELARGRHRLRALVVAYGVNDADHLRFFDATARSDAEEYRADKNPSSVALLNGLSNLHFLDLLRRRLLRFVASHACAPSQLPSLRVAPAAYEENLRALAEEARARSVPLVFVNTAFRYAEKPAVSAEAESAARQSLDRTVAALGAGDDRTARDAAAAAVQADPGVDAAWYALSAAESRLGHCAESRAAFASAREREPHRLHRNLAEYNDIVRRVAESTGAALVDAQALLHEDPALLLDPIHPSARGHAMIADALAARLAARGSEK